MWVCHSVWVCVLVCVCVCVCVFLCLCHIFIAKDFANGQGGSDACTDMEDPENAGLPECLASGEHGKIVARSALAFDALIIPWCLIAVREGFDAVPHNHVPPKQMLKLLLLPFDYLRIVGGRLGIQHRFWHLWGAPSKPTLLATTSN